MIDHEPHITKLQQRRLARFERRLERPKMPERTEFEIGLIAAARNYCRAYPVLADDTETQGAKVTYDQKCLRIGLLCGGLYFLLEMFT